MKTLAVTTLFVVACGIFLVACGGGGSSQPEAPAEQPEAPAAEQPEAPGPTMPEMTITRGGGTLANAVDITGQETVEGELDSPDDADYYELRPEEDVEAVFWMDTADVEFQLLDSEGNVLATSVEVGGGSGASAGRPAPDVVVPIVKAAVRLVLTKGKKYVVKVSPKAGRALGSVRRYVLNHRLTKAALRKIRSFVERRMKAGTTGEFELSGRWMTEEGDLEETYSARLLTPIPARGIGRFVNVGIAVEQTKLKLRLDSVKACQDRASPEEVRIRVVTTVKLPLPDSIPKTIRDAISTLANDTLGFLSGVDDLALTIEDTGANLRSTVTPPIALAVAAGSRATTTLTDFIEDPEGGSNVTFGSGSVSPGLRATLDGPRLTVAATEDAEDGDVKVAATDRNDVCRTFLVRVSVEADRAPRTKDRTAVLAYLGRGETTYTSASLGEYFEYDGPSELTFSSTIVSQEGTGWTHRITGDKLEISQSGMTIGHYVTLDVTATSPAGGYDHQEITVGIGYVRCCNGPVACICQFQSHKVHWVGGGSGSTTPPCSYTEVTNCPLVGRAYSGPSRTRECCALASQPEDRRAGIKLDYCRCVNKDPDDPPHDDSRCDGHVRFGGETQTRTASCSINLF